MKRTLALLLLLATLLSLAACGNTNSAENAVLAQLNDYAAERYENYTVQIVTANRSGGKVTEKYTVTVTDGVRNVLARTEKINGFVIDGDTITAPDEYITVTENTFTVLESETVEFGLPGFRFTKDSLSNIKIDTDSYPYVLSADVISTAALMQDDIDGSDIKLEAEYVTGSLYSIEISYVSENGNQVTVTYTFG